MIDAVTLSHHGAITVVTLDRPDVRNAVDADTARQLYDAFVAFDADPHARVSVFHGAHGHFCAGWDLQAGARMAQQVSLGLGAFAELVFAYIDALSSASISGHTGLCRAM